MCLAEHGSVMDVVQQHKASIDPNCAGKDIDNQTKYRLVEHPTAFRDLPAQLVLGVLQSSPAQEGTKQGPQLPGSLPRHRDQRRKPACSPAQCFCVTTVEYD